MRAIVNGNILIVEKILSLKANLELQDNDGNTALHYACYENKGQIAQILLKHKASPFIKNNANLVPFELAPKPLQNLLINDYDLKEQDEDDWR